MHGTCRHSCPSPHMLVLHHTCFSYTTHASPTSHMFLLHHTCLSYITHACPTSHVRVSMTTSECWLCMHDKAPRCVVFKRGVAAAFHGGQPEWWQPLEDSEPLYSLLRACHCTACCTHVIVQPVATHAMYGLLHANRYAAYLTAADCVTSHACT